MLLAVERGESEDQREIVCVREDPTFRNRQWVRKPRMLVDRLLIWSPFDLWERGVDSCVPEAYMNFLSLQKEINVLDMLALPRFVICPKTHMVEGAVVSCLWVMTTAWESKNKMILGQKHLGIYPFQSLVARKTVFLSWRPRKMRPEACLIVK